MTPEEIAGTLTELFGSSVVDYVSTGSWQIDTPNFRLLVLLSEDNSWLRMWIPIVPIQQAQPFMQQFLEANFDDTQQVRYALNEGVIWGVFQHQTRSLTLEDFRDAVSRLISLHQAGLDDVFNQLVENRIRFIVYAAKQQGQTLEATMQNLERFYAEGLMGDIDQTQSERDRVLVAWRRQLERLWNEE